jgi:hypothetical protein
MWLEQFFRPRILCYQKDLSQGHRACQQSQYPSSFARLTSEGRFLVKGLLLADSSGEKGVKRARTIP